MGNEEQQHHRGIHDSASSGFQRQAKAYERARPTYHPSLAKHIATLAVNQEPKPNPGRLLIELGAGTGIFTGQLVANGCTVTAVEPVEAMRATLAKNYPEITTVAGIAEQIPLPNGKASVVVASQSFHWFDYPRALDEIGRVLGPGGHLVTVWNVRDDRVDWVSSCTKVIERHADSTPRHYTMQWREAIDGDARFEPVADFAVNNPWPTTPQGVVDRVLSTSFIAALGDEEQATVVADIRRIVEPLGSAFDYPYISELQSWRLNER